MTSRFPSPKLSAVFAALLFVTSAGQAIEGPKQQPEQPPAPAPAPKVDLAPTDETQFYETLQRVTHFRNFRGLNVPPAVIEQLSQGKADTVVASLSGLASQGDRSANIALVRVQHWCSRMAQFKPVDPQAVAAKLAQAVPPERLNRIAGVWKAEADFAGRARASCQRAPFDYRGIEQRLRADAEGGDPASATELSQFLRDPEKKKMYLKAAVDKRYAPAMYAEATNLLVAVQRGDTTENVGMIRELLKQAGRTIPKAKLDLANCMALGCDGHPADALTAAAFGTDAARDGEPTAFLSIVRMPWGGRMTRSQKLGWQYFGDRLNEKGCMGDAYIQTSIAFAQSIGMLEQGMNPTALDEAKKQGETLWADNGARAMKENGCG
jgi:hypothetical protein